MVVVAVVDDVDVVVVIVVFVVVVVALCRCRLTADVRYETMTKCQALSCPVAMTGVDVLVKA